MFRNSIFFAFIAALLLTGAASPGRAADSGHNKGMSPGLCGPEDIREPGIQGDVPKGETADYNCGVKLVGQLPTVGNVQGVGKCAYVRTRDTVHVIDVSDPAKPVEVKTVPVKYASESMRVMVNKDRALLVSGSSIYDIKDCLNPVLLGDINWPQLAIGLNPPLGGGGGTGILPHDLRINHAATKVYGSFGLWEVDISNLSDPSTWKVTDHRCEIFAQIPGPGMEMHKAANKAGMSLCDDNADPKGANGRMASSSLQASMLWPQLSHSIDTNADDTLVYVGDQSGGTMAKWWPEPTERIIDVTQHPVKVLGEVRGPGHGLDWFHVGGRDYLAGSNEVGTGTGQGRASMGQGSAARSDTCRPYPRPTALGWGFEVLVNEVTHPTHPKYVSMLHIAINDPEFCDVRKASGRDPTVAYHLIDNPFDAHFAAVNFGSAGLRIFDIRKPEKPTEVAYFNHGSLVHAGVGYYDAARGLIYAPGSSGFWVLELEPQVRARLGL